jgi:amino acid transporter
VGSVIFLYIAISIITVGSVDEKTLMEAKDYALAIAVQPTMGKAGFIIVAIAAILSTFSAIIATVYGNARLGAFLAKKSELPKTFSKKHKDIPMIGVVAVSLFSLILANSMELKEVAIVASGGFLLIFTTVNLSAIILRKQIGANTFITILATILSLISLVVLMLYTYLQDIIALYVFVGFLFFSCLISLFYKKTNA